MSYLPEESFGERCLNAIMGILVVLAFLAVLISPLLCFIAITSWGGWWWWSIPFDFVFIATTIAIVGA